jgi:hypothetical protein
MPFIRVHGRVVHIQDKGGAANKNKTGGYTKTAAMTAAGATVAGTGQIVGRVMRSPAIAIASSAVGVGLGVGVFVRSIQKARNQPEGAPRLNELSKHYLAGYAGGIAGSVLAAVGNKKAVKGAFALRGAAMRGAMAIKPFTAKLAEARKFRKATKVASTVTNPTRGLLKWQK